MKTVFKIGIWLALIPLPQGYSMPLTQFRENLRHFVQENQSWPEHAIVKIIPGPLTSKKPFIEACQQGFNFRFTTTEPRKSYTVVSHCQDPHSKPLYVPVNTRVLIPVITSKVSLDRNQVIKRNHLIFKNVDRNLQDADIINSIDALLGARTKRSIQAGQPLKAKEICLVCKGDTVDIMAATQNLKIVTEGVALNDGLHNDWISVKNVYTGIEVQAKIAQARQVWTTPILPKKEIKVKPPLADKQDKSSIQKQEQIMTIDKLNGNHLSQPEIKKAKQSESSAKDVPPSQAPLTEKTESTDSLKLTEVAIQLQQLQEQARQSSSIDESKVERIRQALSEHSYHIDAKRLADKLFAVESNLDDKK